jgi:hypothetical protein
LLGVESIEGFGPAAAIGLAPKVKALAPSRMAAAADKARRTHPPFPCRLDRTPPITR